MMIFLKLICSLFIISILFTACDDKTVSKHYTKTDEIINLDSINLICIYPDVTQKIKKALKNEKFYINNNSIYYIKVDYTNYKKTCNNPMTSAYDATFDGFIRLTLFKNNNRIYMCQKEFRGELSVSDFEELLTLMRDELNHF